MTKPMTRKGGYEMSCLKCGGEMGQTMMGKWWCPTCVGEEAARKAAKKLKLDFKL